MIYYHATEDKNYINILMNGIKSGFDGCVYLCKDPDHCIRFLDVRGVREDIFVFAIDLDENEVKESHDHNEKFFGCKAYCYDGDIPESKILHDQCLYYPWKSLFSEDEVIGE